MHWLKQATVVTALGAVMGSALYLSLPSQAQVCAPLRAVGGTRAGVQKSVSAPGTLVSRSNWNTDFNVPKSQQYSRYTARITSKNRGDYSVQMFLKYPNGKADKIYDGKASVRDNQTFTITGISHRRAEPYQVNVSVGGVGVLGNTYRVSVIGCR